MAEPAFRLHSSCYSVLVPLEDSGNVTFIWVSPPGCCSGSSSGTAVAPFSPLLPRGCSRVGGRVMLERRWGSLVCLDISMACWCLYAPSDCNAGLRNHPVKSQHITARSQSFQLFCFWHCHYGIMGFSGWWQPLAKKQGVKSPLCAWHSCFAIISKYFFLRQILEASEKECLAIRHSKEREFKRQILQSLQICKTPLMYVELLQSLQAADLSRAWRNIHIAVIK